MDIVEILREHATDWNGEQMVDGEPAKDDPKAGTLRKAADEIERLRATTQWRPIETAPRDGTEIVLLDAKGIPVVGAYKSGYCREFNGEELLEWRVTWDNHPFFDPTAWMPLPPPPVQEEER